MTTEASTPLMRQYHSVKQQVPRALLMFRLGDFYELFYEDAVTAARELEITLTSRNKEKGQAIPMCGVPYHAAEGYIARLIQRGYRVAICDQMEDPRFAKKLVRREITRVVTPGTATDAALLRSRENNYLAAAAVSGSRTGLAHVDVSTGEFRTTEIDSGEAAAVLEQLGARELLVPDGSQASHQASNMLRTDVDSWAFDFDHAERTLREHFNLLTLDGCGLAGRSLAVCAAGAILHYLKDTQRAALNHLERPLFYDRAGSMVLDTVTIRNLELVDPLFTADAAAKDSTLVSVIDKTATGMGARLLRRRLLRPSLDSPEIEARLDAVDELLQATIPRTEVRKVLGEVQDLERLLAKVTMATAGPRELLALARSLARIPQLKKALEAICNGGVAAQNLARPSPSSAVEQAARPAMPVASPAETAGMTAHSTVLGGAGDRCSSPATPGVASRIADLYGRLDELAEVRDRVLAALADDPPLNLADGGTIRDGFHPELDQLRDISRNSRQYVAGIEMRERARTGIQSLKVRFNNIFGYYLEISKANLHLAPADYERKQTLVNAERFTTPELKELEQKILEADEKILELERTIFGEVRSFAASHADRIRATASAVAELDVTAALAQVATEGRYTRPRFSESGEMRIVAGRHPVVEKLTEREAVRFIPNDLFMDAESSRIALITGPNMGGKSTYLRQAALIAILAQTGSFVPAESALLPIVDRVFTRIGASDNLARGRSTFMVEMTETAVILNTATPRSLIVLDEIGRGTATYDGLALAWSVIEHIHEKVGAKTLFATHYHELTELADQLEGVRNLHVSVKESGDQIVFLRKVEPGSADRSYGIEVARLAGLPMGVIERAREILAFHEKTEHAATEELTPRRAGPVQIQLFEPVNYEIAGRIRNLKIEELRPIEALKLLSELQEELKRQ